MGLWMLSFGDHGAAIIEAESMAHARLRVAVKGLVRASSFIEGFQINPEFVPLIPDESIGQKLSREHASELLEMLKNGSPRRSAKLSHLGPPVPTLALPGDETEGHEALQLRALELMGKHHELFTEKHKHDFDTNIAGRLEAAWERINADKGRPDRDPPRSGDQRKAAPKGRH
jgi:hypothetical protein